MWEALMGSAIAPAVQAGIGEAAMQTAVPAITDTAMQAGLDQALTGGLSNIGASTMGQAVGGSGVQSFIPQIGAGAGMFDSLGGFANALGSDQALNVAKMGLGGYNAYKSGQAMDNAQNIQSAQLAQSQDAYNRDKTADQNRQKLVF